MPFALSKLEPYTVILVGTALVWVRELQTDFNGIVILGYLKNDEKVNM